MQEKKYKNVETNIRKEWIEDLVQELKEKKKGDRFIKIRNENMKG